MRSSDSPRMRTLFFLCALALSSVSGLFAASTTVDGLLYNVDSTAKHSLPSTVTVTGASKDSLNVPGSLTVGASSTAAGEYTLFTTNGTYTLTLTPDPAQAASMRLFLGIGSGLWLSSASGTNETVSRVSIQTVTAPSFVTLTDAATVTLTCDPNKTEQNAIVTLGGNRTLSISGVVAGMKGVLKVIQDGTGSRTLTLPASSKVISGGSGAITLTTTASGIDVLCWYYDGSSYLWSYGKNFN